MYRKRGTNQPDEAEPRPRVYKADAVIDAAGTRAAPGAVALIGGRVLAAGEPAAVVERAGEAADARELPGRVLAPGLVNAHAHLDLTEVGPRPYEGDFVAWLRAVTAARPKRDTALAKAVDRGAGLSAAAGVMTVGDIAASPAATAALERSSLRGVSYVEQFGIGIDFLSAEQEVHDQLARWAETEEAGGVTIGLQPHAPYSAGPAVYELAADANVRDGRPISTHLAESAEELQFVAEGDGPFRDLLEELGKWRPAYRGLYSEGLHPVNWLMRSDALAEPPEKRPHWLCAHCNYVGDRQIERLAAFGASVAYCPRASDYFGHRDHRYRDMLDAGVNVCLGTDSIVCHGTLSILDEMRHLHRRDGTDPTLLLAMATVNGMRALELEPADATFAPGARPGLVAIRYDAAAGVDPLRSVLAADGPVELEVLAPAGTPRRARVPSPRRR